MGKRLNRDHIKEGIPMASKHINICSTLFVMRQIQTITMRYHNTSFRTAKIQKYGNIDH